MDTATRHSSANLPRCTCHARGPSRAISQAAGAVKSIQRHRHVSHGALVLYAEVLTSLSIFSSFVALVLNAPQLCSPAGSVAESDCSSNHKDYDIIRRSQPSGDRQHSPGDPGHYHTSADRSFKQPGLRARVLACHHVFLSTHCAPTLQASITTPAPAEAAAASSTLAAAGFFSGVGTSPPASAASALRFLGAISSCVCMGFRCVSSERGVARLGGATHAHGTTPAFQPSAAISHFSHFSLRPRNHGTS